MDGTSRTVTIGEIAGPPVTGGLIWSFAVIYEDAKTKNKDLSSLLGTGNWELEDMLIQHQLLIDVFRGRLECIMLRRILLQSLEHCSL